MAPTKKNDILHVVYALSLVVLLIVMGPPRGFCLQGDQTHFYYGSYEGHVQHEEDPARAEWQRPDKVLDYLLIKKGYQVADIGAGTGYFTVLFSKRVGGSGTVYAVDVERRMLDYIKDRAEKKGLHNITEILADRDDPLLRKSSLDLIFICNTYYNFRNKVQYLKKLKDCLKKGGRLAVIEEKLNSKRDRPPLHKRRAQEKVVNEAIQAGFRLEADIDVLPYQYFLIFNTE